MAKRQKPARPLMEQIADLDDVAPKDFDPEDIDDGQRSDDEGSSIASDDAAAGREHYEAVGKSKLRKPETVTLGREYEGSRVSRNALDGDDNDDDPLRKRSSDEEDSELSDGESGDEDMEGFEDGVSESDEELENGLERRMKKSKLEDEEESDDVDEGDSEQEDDGDASDSDEEQDIPTNDDSKSENRNELRRLMASDQKTVAASISEAAKADAAKGQAVKRQRGTFDALLNSRIKLQKGLSALNDIPETSDDGTTIDVDVVKSAESAALSLWSMLEDLRHTLADANSKDSSRKRKREPVVSTSTPTSLWERTGKIESEVRPHRRAVLDKWSSKVRGSVAPPNSQGKVLNRGGSNQQQSITAVLDAHLATEMSHTTVKNSNSNGVNGSAHVSESIQDIYDDTPFYQSLLRDLVEQRMSSDSLTNGTDNLQNLQLSTTLSIHPTTGMRKDKKKKVVDTRASKGRKMRYTVHEKLQNFMAPEDRGTWGDRAREEFFASLLGRTANGILGEEDEADGVVSEDDYDNEDGGLRLFRS